MMPPPPLPSADSFRQLPNDPISPSTSFANLSLTSPLVNGPEQSSTYFDIVRGGIARSSSPTPGARTWEQTVLGLSIHRRSDPSPPIQTPSPKSTSLPLLTSEPTAGTDPPEPPSPELKAEQGSPVTSTPSIQVHAPPAVDQPSDVSQEAAEESHGATESSEASEAPAQDACSTTAEVSSTVAAAPPPPADVPPAPTKVKLSLKDFAMRKKKQREEESKASPIVTTTPLSDVDQAQGDAERQESSASPAVHKDAPQVLEPVDTRMEPTQEPQQQTENPAAVAEDAPVDSMPPSDSVEVEMAEKGSSDEPAPDPRGDSDTRMEVDGPSEMLLHSHLLDPLLHPRQSTSLQDYSPQSPSPTNTPPSESEPMATTSQTKKENTEPRRSPVPFLMVHAQQPLARQISQEDGEIFSPPPPKPLPLAPRTHSPPTHPRSFNVHSGTTSPTRPSPSGPPRRPLQPAPYRSQLQNTPLNGRPPSGPRALRGVGGGSGRADYYPPFRPGDAPRAPSADRERDHRVDWDRDRRHGSWGRGRGGGGWGAGR